MAFNGAGLFVRLFSWANDAANSINITASRMDSETDGIAAGLSNCITRDGQGRPSAAINWNAQNLTNVAQLGVTGLATFAAGVTGVTDLTTTGNTVLGSSATNTLNVGAGGIVKDSSGNTTFGGSVLAKGTTAFSVATSGVLLGVTGTFPEVTYINSMGGTNSKVWDTYADATSMVYRLVNDAGSASQPWLQVTRSGMTVTSSVFPQGSVEATGGGTTAGFRIGSAAYRTALYDDGSGVVYLDSALGSAPNISIAIRPKGTGVVQLVGAATATTFNGFLATGNVSQFTNDAAYGYRGLPAASVTTGAFVAADAGKCVFATAGVTVPNSTMSAGDVVVIQDTSGTAQTITATITTLRQTGTTSTGNRTLKAYGRAAILFQSGTLAFISGDVL